MIKKLLIGLIFIATAYPVVAQVTYSSLERHPDVQGPMAFQWDGWKEEVKEEEVKEEKRSKSPKPEEKP